MSIPVRMEIKLFSEPSPEAIDWLVHFENLIYTENQYRSMLLLNIKEGFDVIGVNKTDHDEKQTVMLEKHL